MADVCIRIPEEDIKKAEEFNIDLSILFREFIKREILKRELLKRANSEEEKELTEWSVNLGKEAKKGRFKRLLEELPKEKIEKYK